MTTRHATTADLRAALDAALPDLTEDQARAARALIAALAPPIQEPTWPGAPVVAACNGGTRGRLHIRRNDGPLSGWECNYSCACAEWRDLVNPRPLTPAEYAKYGIPEPCTHTTDETGFKAADQ